MRKLGDVFDIVERRGDLCVIVFYLGIVVEDTDHGEEYDMNECRMTTVYYDGIEEDIRANFCAWAAHAAALKIEVGAIKRAVQSILDSAAQPLKGGAWDG